MADLGAHPRRSQSSSSRQLQGRRDPPALSPRLGVSSTRNAPAISSRCNPRASQIPKHSRKLKATKYNRSSPSPSPSPAPSLPTFSPMVAFSSNQDSRSAKANPQNFTSSTPMAPASSPTAAITPPPARWGGHQLASGDVMFTARSAPGPLHLAAAQKSAHRRASRRIRRRASPKPPLANGW